MRTGGGAGSRRPYAYGVEGERRRGAFTWRGPAAGAVVAAGLVLVQLALARFVMGVTIPDAADAEGAVRAWSAPVLAMCVIAGAVGGWAARRAAARALPMGGRAGSSSGRVLASGLSGGTLAGLASLSVAGPGAPGVGLVVAEVLAVTAGAAYGSAAAGTGRTAAVARAGLVSGGAALWLGDAARRLAGVLLMPASPIDADGDLTTAALDGLAHLRVWSPIAYGAGVATAITLAALTAGARTHGTARSPYANPPATPPGAAVLFAAAAAPLVLTATGTALAIPVAGTTLTTIGSPATWAALTAAAAIGALTAFVLSRCGRRR